MALIGLFGVAVAAMLVDLAGNETTRPFTRRAFVLVALAEMGVTINGLVAGATDAAGLLM